MGRFDGVLIATDIDGTLLTKDKRLGGKTAAAIREFMAEGGLFTLASGRMHQSFGLIRDAVPFNAPVIFANGAQIYDYEKDELLLHLTLEEDSAAFAEGVLARFPEVCLEVYRHKESYTVRENDITREHVINFKIPRKMCESPFEIPRPWTKILFTAPHDVLERVAKYGAERFKSANFRFSTPVFLEIFNASTDKGKGVCRLAALCGVEKGGIYTAGDQENDLDMMSVAAVSFAPENAAKEVKAMAGVILPDNENDTIAALIDHLKTIY